MSNMAGFTDFDDAGLTDLTGYPSEVTGWTATENIADFAVMDGDFTGAGFYEE